MIFGGHDRVPVQPSSAGGAPSGAAPLVAKLAILRRPQTALDRMLPASDALNSLPDHRRSVPSLTRLAATLRTRSGVARVFVIVRAPQTPTGAGHSASPYEQDEAWAVTIRGGGANATAGLTADGLYHPGVVAFGNGINQSLVPDGVARVRWVFNGRSPDGVRLRGPVTIYPVVRDNVAISPVVRGQGMPAAAVWYDANGRSIATWRLGENP